jgi:2-phosphosulfolactate phosphatase
MRLDVAVTPADWARLDLGGRAALVVDVLRASTTVVAACGAGCRRVVPVAAAGAARRAARAFPRAQVLLAGEQGGEPIRGFDLGNSPLEFTAERVWGRTVVLATTNGTAAMVRARGASAAAVAALTNLDAAAGWALDEGRDVVVLCAGEAGAFSLEDAVCAGLLVERLARGTAVECSDAAVAVRRLAEHYGSRLDRLREDSCWARHLVRAGHGADVEACLRVGDSVAVPVWADGGIVPRRAALTGLPPGTDTGTRCMRSPERSR